MHEQNDDHEDDTQNQRPSVDIAAENVSSEGQQRSPNKRLLARVPTPPAITISRTSAEKPSESA